MSESWPWPASLTEIYLPARNEPDLDDVPAEVLAAVTVHLVADVREILATALEPELPNSQAAGPTALAAAALRGVASSPCPPARGEGSTTRG
jgi:hypothetical protein